MIPLEGMASDAIAELGGLGQRFVCWRWETRRGKPTKPPLRPAGGYADSTDPASWSSLDDAMAGASVPGIEGIGFVLDAGRDGIVGIDLDCCRDPETGKVEVWATRIINAVMSYAEISPSGTGVKILVRANPVPAFAANKAVIRKANGTTGKDQAVEIYTTGRYFCLTGQLLPGLPDEIVEATEAVEKLAHWLAKKSGAKEAHRADSLPGSFLELLERDDRLREAWETGVKLGGGPDTSSSALDWSLALYLRPHPDDGDIVTVLRHHRHGQIGGGKLKSRDGERRLEKIVAELPLRRVSSPGCGLATDAPTVEAERAAADVVGDALFDTSHDGLALGLGEQWADARHVALWGSWLFWTGSRWERDELLIHYTRTREFLRTKGDELVRWAQQQVAAGEAKDKLIESCEAAAKTLRSAQTVANVVGLARSNPTQAASVAQWDADPFKLGAPAPGRNGP